MKKIQLKSIEHCTPKDLIQEAQRQQELEQRKRDELFLMFATYCNNLNLFAEKEIQYLRSLREFGIKIKHSVFAVLMALHHIGIYHKSGFLLTNYDEIRKHFVHLSDKTICNALKFLHEEKLIVCFKGRGFRQILIVLKMFYILNN